MYYKMYFCPAAHSHNADFSWFSAFHGNFSMGLHYFLESTEFKPKNVFDLRLWYIINQQNGSNGVPCRCSLWVSCSAVLFALVLICICQVVVRAWKHCSAVSQLFLGSYVVWFLKINMSLEIWHFSFIWIWGFFFPSLLNGSLYSRVSVLIAPEQRCHYLYSFSLITAAISPVILQVWTERGATDVTEMCVVMCVPYGREKAWGRSEKQCGQAGI